MTDKPLSLISSFASSFAENMSTFFSSNDDPAPNHDNIDSSNPDNTEEIHTPSSAHVDAAINNILNPVDADFDKHIEHIEKLLQLVEADRVKKSSDTHRKTMTAEGLFKLKDFLSEATNIFTHIIPSDPRISFLGFLHNMGPAHLTTTALLVVANILERFEEVSNNKDECLRLLKEIIFLAKVVKQIKERPQLEEGMSDQIKKATELMMEGSIKCSSQMGTSQFSDFFSATANGEELGELAEKFEDTYKHIYFKMGIQIHDTKQAKPMEMRLSRRNFFPEDAVGIQEPIREVIDLLEWASNEKAVAVILHGFGGIGKSTLGNAVFSILDIEGSQYSSVKLFKDTNTAENTTELQNQILKDLKPNEDVQGIRKWEDGQIELGKVLKEVEAFIYIDNVLGEKELRRLLPENMNNAKKVRFLLTARDINHCNACTAKKMQVYTMKDLHPTGAKSLFDKEMDKVDKGGDKKQQKGSRPLSKSQVNQILNFCGGIPILLKLVAGFIRCHDNKQKAFQIVKEDKVKLKGKHFDDIEHYVFAYENLPEGCKDPFLDICNFFKGMDWQIVEDVVGMSELDSLEKMALVTKDINGVVSVHDVILTLGHKYTKETRLKSTSASEIEKFLNSMEDKDIQNIKGIWLNENKDLLHLSAEKLDLMHRSLRILHLGNLINVDGKCKRILKNLIFFQGAVPFLPFNVKEVKALKYLSYQPKELKLREMPADLRNVDFDGRLHSRAFEISWTDLEQLNNLRILKLTRFAMLKRLSEELGDKVNALQELTLSHCESIEELPSSISNLELRVLRIDHCSSLMHLPEFFTSLQELNLQGCKHLKELPNSFEKLSKLKLLDLSSCQKLAKLPHGIGYLTSLVNLSLDKCANLRSIPESIGRLKSLAFSMDMSGCSTLTELPYLFGQLEYIRELNLRECSNLEKLPESFIQLRNLEKLNLSNCITLQELCHSFHLLSKLRILDLSGCKMLEELPPYFRLLSSLENLYLTGCERLQKLSEDFHCLPSLQHLYLCYCDKLDGKLIDSLLNMKKLQIINIQESSKLVNRWEELQRKGNQSLSTAVYTGKDLSEEEKEKIFSKLLSELDDGLLVDKSKNTFRISELPPNKVSLVMFHSDPEDDFPGPLMEETIDDIRDLNFELIYIGKHFDKFPSNVKDRISGRSVENREVGLMLVKLLLTLDVHVRDSWLSTLDENVQNVWLERYIAEEPVYFQMTMEDRKGQTPRPCWKVLSNYGVEEFVFGKCKKFLELNKLVEPPQEKDSNIRLLRELFGTRTEETIFERGHASNQDPTDNSKQPFTCRVDNLNGKTILLEMGCGDLCNDIGLWSLAEMYRAEKDKLDLDLEIISLPLPIVQSSTQLKVVDRFEPSSREVPWLVLQNPLTMTRASKYFLAQQAKYFFAKQTRWKREGKDNILHSNIIWVIESNGRISICKSFKFFILNIREPKAYPFKKENFEELRKTEWNQLNQLSSISSIEFLLKHLESVFKQVENKMLEGKMVCLYGGNKEFTCYIRNVLIELTDRIHILYIPRHGHGIEKMLKITDNIYKEYYSLEKPEMPSVEMEGISLLTEHETIRFWMSLRYLKEEIDGMCNNDKEFYEMKSLPHLVKLMDEGDGNGWMIFIGKNGKMVTACGGEIMKWLFKDDEEHTRAKRLIKKLVEEETEEIHHDSSIPASTNSMQTVVVRQKNVDVDLNSLSKYTSELLEMVQIQHLLGFNKEKKLSRPKAALWPNTIGSRLKKFLSVGITVVNDIISQHPEEDILEMVNQSLVEGISGETQLAAAGLLVVAEILEAFGGVNSANRNECLFLLEEMNRVAQHIKQFNERPHLTEETMRKATMWIVHCSIMCCGQIDHSKFAMFFRRPVNKKELRRLQKWLRNRSQEVFMPRFQDDLYKNEENGSPRSSAMTREEDVASSSAPNQDSPAQRVLH